MNHTPVNLWCDCEIDYGTDARGWCESCRRALDPRIAALTAERDALLKDRARLVVALAPFATGGVIECIERGDYSVMKERIVDWHGPSDFRAAKAALAAMSPRPIGESDVKTT